MRKTYKKIGDYIQLVDERNKGLKVQQLLGLSISKQFIPSVANIIGTDMENYKIIRKNQFACSTMQVRRDKKMPVALLQEVDEAIISQAYPIFEISKPNELLPEYLMMWFTRSEFDREACFNAVGGVRGSLEWEDFCDMQLPIPSIAKQLEIVKEYYVVINRIKLNQQLIQKLEETAQAIYKQWFVDFEFPSPLTPEGGTSQGYKSSSGEMVFNEEFGCDIPKCWRNGTLNELVDVIDGDRGTNYPSIEEMFKNEFCMFLNAGNVTKIGFDFSEVSFITKEKDKELRKGKLKRNDIVLTSRGTVGNVGFYSDAITFNNIRINSGMVIMRAKDFSESSIFIYSLLRNSEIKKAIENYLSGSAQPQLPIRDLIKIPILIPSNDNIISFSKLVIKIQNQIDRVKIQNQKIKDFANLLLSKLATIEN
jgi:type I restriction enzyme S subunit